MRPTAVAVGLPHRAQLITDHLAHFLGRAQQRLQFLNQGQQFLVFVLDLLALQGSQPAQLHVQDSLSLDLAQLEALDQPDPGGLHIRRLADDVDHFIQVFQRRPQPFQDMRPLAGFLQVVLAAPADDLLAMLQVNPHRLLEAQQARLAVHQGQHVDAEGGLHGGVLVQVAQDKFRLGGLAQLDHNPHSLAIRFIPQVGDALQLLLPHQLGNALDQGGFVGHVGQFGDNDPAAAALHLLQVGPGLDIHPATPGAVGAHKAFVVTGVDDHPAGGEIRPLDEAHQVFDADLVQLLPAGEHELHGIHDLAQVMRRDAGGHAHGNTGGPVDQQVRQGCGQHHRLGERAIEVGPKVDRVFGDVRQHVHGRMVQASLGVAHRCRGVAIHAAKVTLAVHQLVAHGEILGHAGHGFVNRLVAMGVVLAQHFAHDAGGLLVGRIGTHTHVVHGVQDPAVDRLQPIASIRQGASYDHAHGIIQVRLLHLTVNINFLNQANFHYLPPPLGGNWVLSNNRVYCSERLKPPLRKNKLD